MKTALLAVLALCVATQAAFAQQGRTKPPAQAERERNNRTEAILKSKVISVDFKDAAFGDVMKFIQTITGVNIVVDPEVYASSSEEDLRVTLKVDELPAISVLDLILKFKKLGRSYRFGVLLISSSQKAMGEVSMRIYDVRDLSVPLKDYPGPDLELKTGEGGMTPLFGEEEQEVKHYSTDEIVTMIRDNTGDGSWDENPKCRITIFKGMLIVVQSDKVHTEINKMLQNLRATR